MMSRTACCLAVVLVAASAFGQVLRGRVAGTVKLAGGGPWTHARVTFLSRPFAKQPDLDRADVVHCETNDKGRFRAQLLEQRVYECWAVAVEDGGSYRVSNVAAGVVCGSRVALVEAAKPRKPGRVRIENLDAWNDHGPFRVRVEAVGIRQGWRREVALDGAELQLPRVPGGELCSLSLIAANGRVVHRFRRIGLTEDARAKQTAARRKARAKLGHQPSPAASPDEKPGVARLWLPPRQTVTVIVRGPNGPAASVRVACSSDRDAWQTVGSTDAEGRLRVALPFDWQDNGKPKQTPDLLIRGPGIADNHASSLGRFDGGVTRDKPEHTFVAMQGHVLKGRIVVAGKAPHRTIPLLLYSSVRTSKSGSRFGIGAFVHWTRKDGTFAIEGRHADMGHRLCAVLTHEDLQGVEFVQKRGFYPIAILHESGKAGTVDQDLGTIDLAQLHLLELAVEEPDGAPADRALARVSEVARSVENRPYYPVRAQTTRRGRLGLLLRRGSKPGVLVATRNGFSLSRLEVPEDTSRSKHVVRLSNRFRIKGTVYGPDGEPAANATVRTSWTSARGPFAGMLHRFSGVHAVPFRSTKAKANGEFELCVPVGNCRYDVYASWRKDGKYLSNRSPARADLLDGPVTGLEVRVDARSP